MIILQETELSLLKFVFSNGFDVRNQYVVKDRDSTAPKRGSVFIGLMTPDGQYGPGIKGLS